MPDDGSERRSRLHDQRQVERRDRLRVGVRREREFAGDVRIAHEFQFNRGVEAIQLGECGDWHQTDAAEGKFDSLHADCDGEVG